MTTYKPGDFVACYVSNTKVSEELLIWGMVISVSPTLEDIFVLDRDGNSNWWPRRRWRPLENTPIEHPTEIKGVLAWQKIY